ncbi:hypothetical protein WS86_00325 (plasmid) [Burkholderia savannae]|uniref:GNAT family N-acetyltransferase n=1 Tax=Burkholderia savannae TaxID=1637837 RepID=UPI00075EA13A|nr:GNAT family N-acetyltransferase [Burkholderia savannae]AOJ79218.1 hypothetical protein WS86_00325 [Burkholderia savannae]
MTRAPFEIVPLTEKHGRKSFECGTTALDRYFHDQVTQDIRRRVAACFVAVDDAGLVAGYYTLAAASVALTDLPHDVARKLPRYPSVPAVRMGRLAVDGGFRGAGLGGALLVNALRRAAAAEIPAVVMLVDAKDDQAAAFYRHYGFVPFADSPRTLFYPLAGIR